MTVSPTARKDARFKYTAVAQSDDPSNPDATCLCAYL